MRPFTLTSMILLSWIGFTTKSLAGGTAPSLGTTTFNNAFSGTTNLLGITVSPGTVANLGNTGETTGIMATGWDASITAPTGNVSMSASAAGANPGGGSDFCIRMNSLTGGINVQTTSIKSDDGSAFSLQTVFLKLNITAGSPANMIITGYKAGVAVTGATLTVNGLANAIWTSFDVTAVPAFGNVDEFRFTQALTSAATITFEVVDQITIAAAILPLSLVSFSGRFNGTDIQLDWTTAEEQNTLLFEVQRSESGADFTAIGQVPAAGRSTGPLQYDYTDDIGQTTVPAYYYRLRMVDIDAHFTFSPVLIFSSSPDASPLSVYPNPFGQTASCRIGSPASCMSILTISDLSGRKIMTEPVFLQKGSNTLVLPPMDHWPIGIYVLSISSPGRQQTIRILKNE